MKFYEHSFVPPNNDIQKTPSPQKKLPIDKPVSHSNEQNAAFFDLPILVGYKPILQEERGSV